MKSFGTSVIALAIALALGGAAYAQGRHRAHARTPRRAPARPAKKTKKTDTKKADDKKPN